MGVTCNAGEAFAGGGAFVCCGNAGFGSQFAPCVGSAAFTRAQPQARATANAT